MGGVARSLRFGRDDGVLDVVVEGEECGACLREVNSGKIQDESKRNPSARRGMSMPREGIQSQTGRAEARPQQREPKKSLRGTQEHRQECLCYGGRSKVGPLQF